MVIFYRHVSPLNMRKGGVRLKKSTRALLCGLLFVITRRDSFSCCRVVLHLTNLLIVYTFLFEFWYYVSTSGGFSCGVTSGRWVRFGTPRICTQTAEGADKKEGATANRDNFHVLMLPGKYQGAVTTRGRLHPVENIHNVCTSLNLKGVMGG